MSPEIVSMMTKICVSIRQIIPEDVPCGLQVDYNSSKSDNSYLNLLTSDTGCSE